MSKSFNTARNINWVNPFTLFWNSAPINESEEMGSVLSEQNQKLTEEEKKAFKESLNEIKTIEYRHKMFNKVDDKKVSKETHKIQATELKIKTKDGKTITQKVSVRNDQEEQELERP